MSEHDHRSATGLRAPGRLGPGSAARTVLLVLLTYAVVGAVAGVVWEWVWTPPGQVITQHQVFYDSYASIRREFTGTGIYVLVAVGGGALAAFASCLLGRGRELLVLVMVLVGSAVAALVMRWVGTTLGPGDPASLAAHTVARTRVSGKLTVAGKSPYLAWPMASLFVLAILYFAWPGSSPDHGRHEATSTDPVEDDTSTTPRG
jgi:hypothetical protein